MLKYCLILGMTIALEGKPPRDEYHFSGLHEDMNQCQLAGKEWRKQHNGMFAAVWTICSPEGTLTYKYCKSLEKE